MADHRPSGTRWSIASRRYVGAPVCNMYYIYILVNSSEKYYVGSTSQIGKRLKKHNDGGAIWTKKYRPWKLIYSEEFELKSEAVKREKQIKAYKGGNAFKKLVNKK